MSGRDEGPWRVIYLFLVFVVVGGAAINESDPQRLAMIVLIVPGPFRKLKLTEFWVKQVLF